MKRFVKLAAVFTVLMLALACFVACSSEDDSSSTGSTTVLEGLWIMDEFIDDDDIKEGYYFKGNTLYPIGYANGKYYYIEDSKESFFVSGNKIVVYYDGETDELPFTIRGNTMTLIMSGETFTLKKVDRIPTKITSSEFDNMF